MNLRNIINLTNKVFIILLIGLLFNACISGAGSNKKKKSTSSSTGTNYPDFTGDDFNKFVYHNMEFTSVLPISIAMNDTIYLKGKMIHKFIDNGNNNIVQCLVSHYTTTVASSKILVNALRPGFTLDQANNIKENYFFFSPADKISNQHFCQKTGLINALNIKYPGESIAYSLSDLGIVAITSITSDYSFVHSEGGIKIDQLPISNLSLKINSDTNQNGNNTVSCITSTECKQKGYDCCSMNQCVRDGKLIDGTNTSSTEYIQAILDMQQNNKTFTDYPNFFHVCGSNIPITPTPTPLPNPIDAYTSRMEKLKNLYECTTPQEGEMAVCTKTHQNALLNTYYQTGNDDRNFRTTLPSNTTMPTHSIVELVYAGDTIFNKNEIYNSSNGKYTIGQGNDTLIDPVSIMLTNVTPGINNPDLDLKIRYKIDGSCEKINSLIAKCKKYYIQGENSNPVKVTDHPTGTDLFLIPTYADISKNIIIEVDNIIKTKNIHWQLVQGSPASIQFIGIGQQVFDTQEVIITFYVTSSNISNVLQSKQTALEEIDNICNCGGANNCYLKPKTVSNLGVETINDYDCVYPNNSSTPVPLQQMVYLNPKTVPVRFFDEQGVSKNNVTYETIQEGSEFKYYKDNLLKPNNLFDNNGTFDESRYIGFNEIYGSLTYKTDSAKPAKEIRVVKNQTYDIFVDSGVFSSCYFCGNDYYSNLAKIFPINFNSRGGGYSPKPYQTSRINADPYRVDEMHFGRSCYIPATMIPWTHRETSDRQQQRLRRQSAQHFLFANGYNRDWYGFDYGSIIGSFDGVKWFSIGNERRIKATSNKLFLAVNAYFGDLTLANQVPFQISIQDSITTIITGELVSNDFDSDGAECQEQHLCETDLDCATQLGWNYSCETISGISTSWPTFDENGLEIPNASQQIRLTQLIKNATGHGKRCVYRGKGAPCHTNYNSIYTVSGGASSAYDGTKNIGLHSCISNSYCQNFRNADMEARFNDKISRFGKSVKYINNDSSVPINDTNEFGLGSIQLGRPYKYVGKKVLPPDVEGNLSANNLISICLPGRDPSNNTILNSHATIPGTQFAGDQVLEIGMTPSSNSASANYLSSCSILDEHGNYFYKDTSHYTGTMPSLTDATLSSLAAGQALPTNALKVFESQSFTGDENILKDFISDQVTSITLQENRCLRAPGSSCHTDLDCAPSWYTADKLSGISAEDYGSILNKFEIKFWQEKLVCSQEYDSTDSLFKIKNNKCCREQGKELTIATQRGDATSSSPNGTTFTVNGIPGVVSAIDSSSRYSRMSAVYYETINEPTKYPNLITATINQCSSGSCMSIDNNKNQFFTFGAIAEKTCCDGHWIRNFSKENGGGHTWDYSKMQAIDKSTFKCFNWSVCTPNADSDLNTCGTNFTCDHTDKPDDANCKMYSIRDLQANKIFDWFGTLELTGIPQIMIKAATHPDILCRVNESSQQTAGTVAPSGVLGSTTDNNAEYYDPSASTERYLSAIDKDNFDSNLKQVFSADTTNCCLPTATLTTDSDANVCCSGYHYNTGNQDSNNKTLYQCALPDFANVSVYLNRYVSSAAKKLSDSYFDEYTGFIKDTAITRSIACQEKLCVSDKLIAGISLNLYKVPGHANNSYQVRRFISSNDDQTDNYMGLADLYDQGLRWNNHWYCYPSKGSDNSAYLNVYDCGND